MKKIIIAITALFTLSSCELDLKPESSLTYNGFWETEEAVRAAHTGIYASFRGRAGTFWLMGEARADVWGGRTLESASDQNLIDNKISSTQVYFANWAGFYGTIHYMNDFIKNAPNVTFANESDKNHLLGQVYGMRAFMYYTMLKAWGKVPIATEPLTKVDLQTLKKKRASKEEVMAFVKADIAKSLEYFATSNIVKWNNSSVYWSKAATLALKGDVFLWSGKVFGGGNVDFQEAKNALQAITGYSLVAYSELWGQLKENNNEFIFAFDYQQDQAENYYNLVTARQVDINGRFDENGNSLRSFVVNGHSRYGASDKIITALYANPDDQRKNTFIRMYADAAATNYESSILNKFLGIVDSGLRRSWNNVPLYRYADVLLLLAEAKNQLNEDPSAEINQVRARAYGSKYDATTNGYTSSTKENNTKAILDERYKEFVGEGKRWWDLVRAGDNYLFEEVSTIKASEAYKIYYSISESMIANDPELKQTEGY